MASEENKIRKKEYKGKKNDLAEASDYIKIECFIYRKKILANPCSCNITAYYDNLVLINMK